MADKKSEECEAAYIIYYILTRFGFLLIMNLFFDYFQIK